MKVPDTLEPLTTKVCRAVEALATLDVPKVEQYLIWHSSDDNDGSHIWMRELITEAFDAAKTS